MGAGRSGGRRDLRGSWAAQKQCKGGREVGPGQRQDTHET